MTIDKVNLAAAFGECQMLLLEPNSTLDTGNVETEKTRRALERLD